MPDWHIASKTKPTLGGLAENLIHSCRLPSSAAPGALAPIRHHQSSCDAYDDRERDRKCIECCHDYPSSSCARDPPSALRNFHVMAPAVAMPTHATIASGHDIYAPPSLCCLGWVFCASGCADRAASWDLSLRMFAWMLPTSGSPFSSGGNSRAYAMRAASSC